MTKIQELPGASPPGLPPGPTGALRRSPDPMPLKKKILAPLPPTRIPGCAPESDKFFKNSKSVIKSKDFRI